MNIAVKLAKTGELPCEGYPVSAITIDGTDIPAGYDSVLTTQQYEDLKTSLETNLRAYQNSVTVNSDWSEAISRRDLELNSSDWTDLNSAQAVLGYYKLTAYRIYRQQLRDVTEYSTPLEVVFPSVPTDELMILTCTPKITTDNTNAWTDLLWRSCYDFRFNYISDEGITKINTLADLGFSKSVAIRNWIDSLWMTVYYPRKAQLLAGQETNFDFMTNNTPPFTVWEALAEALG